MTTASKDDRITIGEQVFSPDDAQAALGNRMRTLPADVHEIRSVKLGTYHGLEFGMVLHPYSPPEVYLQGDAIRHGNLARDAGPRAALNALDRVIESYPAQTEKASRELGVAQGQLRDYQARIGKPFAHDAYQRDLATLRDQLKAGLSGATEQDGKALPPVAEVAEKIKALRASHTVETAPARPKPQRKATVEHPVTARIKPREEPPTNPQQPEPIIVPPTVEPATPSFRELVTRRAGDERQMRLF